MLRETSSTMGGRPSNSEVHPWHEAITDIPITYQWWYDTTAILAEYDDSERGILPEGTILREADRDDVRGVVTCELEKPREIERSQLPKGRVRRMFLFCRATPLEAVMTIEEWNTKTKPAQQAEDTDAE